MLVDRSFIYLFIYFLCKFFFKTGSLNTIHTFKNYFVTVFLVFSNTYKTFYMLVNRSFCFFGSSSSSSDSSSSKPSYFLMLGKVIYGMRAFVLAHEKYHKSPNLINELQKHLTLAYPPIRQNNWRDSNLEINITYRYATFGPRLHMYTQQSLITCESLPICSCPLQMTFFLQPWKFLRPSMGITCHTMIWHNISNTLLLDFF